METSSRSLQRKRRMRHTFFISSVDSLHKFPENSPTDFSIILPLIIHLDECWTVELCDISFGEEMIEDLMVCCSLCNDSFIRDTELPVLHVISANKAERHIEFRQTLAITAKTASVKVIRIFIRTLNRIPPSFLTKPVRCTVAVTKWD